MQGYRRYIAGPGALALAIMASPELASADIRFFPSLNTECNDGIDNDGDLAIDRSDSGCVNFLDDSEAPGFQRGDRERVFVDWRQFVAIIPPPVPDPCPECSQITIIDYQDLVGRTIPQVFASIPQPWTPLTRNVLETPIASSDGAVVQDSPNIPNLILRYSGPGVTNGPFDFGELRTQPGFTFPTSFTFVGQGRDSVTLTIDRNLGKSSTQATNSCSIFGSFSYRGPGVPTARLTGITASYYEFGPFEEVVPTNMAMEMQLSPPIDVINAPPSILPAALQTMGFNEGPPMLSAVGDRGHITIDWGPCGLIDDDFEVGSTQPYRIDHVISGSLDLSGFEGTDPNAATIRTVRTAFTANGASGTLTLAKQTAGGPEIVVCQGTLSATYTVAHATIALPAQFVSRVVFKGDPNPMPDSDAFAFLGTRTRTRTPRVPASPPVFSGVLALALLGSAMAWLRRRSRSAGT